MNFEYNYRGFKFPDSFITEHGFRDNECELCREDSYGNPTPSEIKKVNMKMFAQDVWDIMDDAGNLLIDKQEDYGPLNIARAPGGPLNGLRVRIFDKISRINNLIDTGAEPNHESLRDSFIDLLNYSAIALMVIDGTWPELPDKD